MGLMQIESRARVTKNAKKKLMQADKKAGYVLSIKHADGDRKEVNLYKSEEKGTEEKFDSTLLT